MNVERWVNRRLTQAEARISLGMNADRSTPIDAGRIPPGDGMPFDFRVAQAIGAGLRLNPDDRSESTTIDQFGINKALSICRGALRLRPDTTEYKHIFRSEYPKLLYSTFVTANRVLDCPLRTTAN